MLFTILIAQFAILFAAVIVVGFVLGFIVYKWTRAGKQNSALDARCNAAFADIDIHPNRNDLIPRLLRMLKSQTGFEKEMVEMVSKGRTNALIAMSPNIRFESEKKLSAQFTNLRSHVKIEHVLRSLPFYEQLRKEIIVFYNQITAVRRFYNLVIEKYNISLTVWPTSAARPVAAVGAG